MDADATRSQLAAALVRVAGGDRAALRTIYQDTSAKLFGVCLRILNDRGEAEDVLQDVYVTVWRKAATFDPGRASPITWMVAIARNRALDIIRKKTEVSIEDEPAAMDAAGDEPNPLARREMTEELRRLLACLGQLDEERRRMVLLAYYSGWSRDQLAVQFDAPTNTIKTWLRRSLLEIRECLGS
jgi:RNA polymerase sigma-70 factor (ECF subfamily)